MKKGKMRIWVVRHRYTGEQLIVSAKNKQSAWTQTPWRRQDVEITEEEGSKRR